MKIIDFIFKSNETNRSFLSSDREVTTNTLTDTPIKDEKVTSDGVRFVHERNSLICKGHPEISEIIAGTELGENMALFAGTGRMQFLVNTKSKICRKIVDMNGVLCGFDESDFDWVSIKRLKASKDGLAKKAIYGIIPFDNYTRGICALSWRIKNVEDKGNELDILSYKNDELLYGIFDTNCNMILPWQPITDINMFMKNLIKGKSDYDLLD